MKYAAFALIVSAVGFSLPATAQQAIGYEQTVSGELTENDGFDILAFYDLYSFTGARGDQVEIRMLSDAFDAYLELYDSAFVDILAEDDDGGGNLNAMIRFVLPEDGTYVISATALDEFELGNYQLQLSRTATGLSPVATAAAGKPTPASAASAPSAGPRTIAYGQSLTSVLDEGDPRTEPFFNREEFYFDGAAGDMIEIRANSSEMDPYVYLYPPAGIIAGELDSDDDGGEGLNSLLTYTLSTAGRHLVVVSSYEYGAYDLALNRVSTAATPVAAPAAAAAAAPAAPATGDALSYGQTVQSNLQKGDRMNDGKLEDSYRFTGRAGDFVVIDMMATYDTYLRLARAAAPGNQIAYDDDTGDGLNARLVHRLDQAGEYIVYATTVSADTIGPYALSLQLGTPPSTDTRPIEFGRQVKALLTDGEPTTPDGKHFQAYRFSATAGEQITVTLRSIAFDTYLRLYGAADMHGAELAYDDDSAGDGDSRITYTIPSTGDYVILATSYDMDGRGAYSLDLAK